LVFLYPGEEPIALRRREGGGLLCTAKTSTAGPGYHRLVVALMDHLAEDLGLDWAWSGDETCEGDETGYGGHRDFDRLQQYMAAFLRRLCGILLEHLPAHPTLMTGVAPELGTPRAEGVISRLGVRPAALIREIADASDHDLLAHAADWYPWWDEAMSARAWRNLGLGLMWVELPWTRPTDEEEQWLYELALHAMAQAAALDPALDLPAREIAEVRALLAATPEPERPPAPDGIGYRRGPLRVDVGDGWSLEAPGYFWRQVLDDGCTLAFAHGRRLIMASTLGLEPRPGRADARVGPPDGASFVFERDGLTGWADLERQQGADGAPWCKLRGTVASPTGAAIISVGFADEADLPWAKAVLESVRFRPPSV
jgi:hypothetical protein